MNESLLAVDAVESDREAATREDRRGSARADAMVESGVVPGVLPGVGPAAWAALIASAIIATTYALGASWLGASILGLPLGFFLICGASAAAGVMSSRRAVREDGRIRPGTMDRTTIEPPLAAPGTLASGVMNVASAACEVATRGAKALFGEENVAGVERSVMRSLSQWPARTLRIGVQGPRALGSAMAAAIDPALAHWYAVAETASAEREMMRRGLDAVVCVTDGRVSVHTPQRPGRDAAWHDWSTPRPISFLSVFAGRIDSAGFVLEETPPENEAQVLGALVTLCAATARDEARLSLADRLRGRVPLRRVTERALDALVAQARRYGPGYVNADMPQPLARAAARVLSAAAASEAFALDDAKRRAIAELAARLAGDEAEVMLRVGAARLADVQDEPGIDALIRAERMLRDARVLPGVNHEAFVFAEVNAGAQGPLGVGRVAAALVLAISQSPIDEIGFIATDVIDDLRHSEWLIGRDQDCAVLQRVCRAIERARRAEAFALPERVAA